MASTATNFKEFAEYYASTSPLRNYGAGASMTADKKKLYIITAVAAAVVIGGIAYAMQKKKKEQK